MDFCGLCCNNSKIEDNTCKTCEQLNKMQEEYAKLLDYRNKKEQNRTNKIKAKIKEFTEDGLLKAKIEKVKNEDSKIFKATHKKLQIINNEGKPPTGRQVRYKWYPCKCWCQKY